MRKVIYADNAATTQLSERALEAMLPYLQGEFGNASQSYTFSRSAKLAIKKSREIVAECIGALPDEIFFTSGGTESDNWVIQGAMYQCMPIVTSSIEHHAILKPCEWAKGNNCDVKMIPVSHEGVVSLEKLSSNLYGKKGIVSIMYANNEIGTIQPVERIARLCHNNGWLFHTDAVQAVGHVFIDVKKQGIDMLSASAHKFNGPKGIGFLYIKKGIEWPSLIMGGSQERAHRAGTENVASIVGMAVALRENVDNLEKNANHLLNLENILLTSLTQTGVHYHRNGAENHIAGNVSLSFYENNGESIMHRLDLIGVSVSTGSACDSQKTQISHVLKAINLDNLLAKGTIRISFGKNNTKEDVGIIHKHLVKILTGNQ